MSRYIVLAALAGAISLALIGCGGSGSSVSVSALAKCAHAKAESISSLPQDTPSQYEVVSKTVKGGWMKQTAGEATANPNTPQMEIYVFPCGRRLNTGPPAPLEN